MISSEPCDRLPANPPGVAAMQAPRISSCSSQFGLGFLLFATKSVLMWFLWALTNKQANVCKVLSCHRRAEAISRLSETDTVIGGLLRGRDSSVAGTPLP